MPKSKRAPDAVARGDRGGRRADPRLGRRRHGAALRQRARGHRGPARRSSRRARRTCFATQPRHRARHRQRRVEIALHGERRRLDVGRFNGERFAVMAGAGFDAAMIKRRRRPQGPPRPRRLRARAAPRTCTPSRFEAKIKVDGTRWYEGPRELHPASATSASCSAASRSSRTPQPDDGLLDLGVAHRRRVRSQLARAVARTAIGDAQKSPFVRVTKARKVKVKLDRKVRYELDGGDRTQGQVVQGRRRARRDHGLRPARGERRRAMRIEREHRQREASAARRGARATQVAGRAARWAGSRASGLVARGRRLRDHRRARAEARARRRRQGDQPAGRAEDDRRPVLRQDAADRSWRSAWRGYALWRLIRAAVGHGAEQRDSGFDRDRRRSPAASPTRSSA